MHHRPHSAQPAQTQRTHALRARGVIWGVCAIWVLTLLGSPWAHAADPRVRVVSQAVGNDEFLLAVAEPDQIAALSHLARDSDFSAISQQAAAYPCLTPTATAETILSHAPTLVLFTDFSRPELVEQVRRTGIRILIINKYNTLDDAYESLRLIANELGEGAKMRAEKIIADNKQRLDALQKKLTHAKPVRVIAPSTYGLIPGDDSTFQDLCDHARAENLAATLGRIHGHQAAPSEKMLTWPVEKVVLTASSRKEKSAGIANQPTVTRKEKIEAALAPFKKLPPYHYMDAIRESHVALLEPWQLSCVSHLRIEAYERLARELHPQLFEKESSP